MRTMYLMCIALLCFTITVSGEEKECGASSLFCPKKTGGTCDILNCDESRHAVPVGHFTFTGEHCHCGCTGNLCAINGQCLTTTTTTARPNDAQCDKAYEDRCFDQMPFTSSGKTGSCCGKCNTGDTNNKCQWSFEETNPKHGFGGTFELDGSSECEKACNTLNSAKITRYDFCEVEATPTHAVIVACGNAKQNLKDKVPSNLCEREAEGDRVCKWSHTRQSAHSPCGNGEPTSSSISGKFNYASDSKGHKCDRACEALGRPNAEPADFCDAGKIASIVRECDPAWSSLNESKMSPDWCDMTFTELTANPQIKVAAASNGDTCDNAYRNDCWKQGAFKHCCDSCNEHSASATCQWSFTGPSEYEGDECKHEPTTVIGNFQFPLKSDACFLACNKLSHGILEKEDLCEGSELNSAIHGCEEAKTSVQDALKTTTWCLTNHSESKEEASALQAVMLASGDQCKAAYDQRCWEQKPWSDCCAKCSAGTDERMCTWSFHEDWHDFSMKGSFGMNSDGCINACNLFNNHKNKRSTYCSGDVYKATAECPEARASLMRELPNKFCEDTEKSHATCTWRYSYDSHPNSVGYHLTGFISSNFDYVIPDDDNDISCQTACAALGYNNNLPSSYCDGSDVWNKVKKCSPAMESLKVELKNKPDLEKAWCAPESVRANHNSMINYFIPAVPTNPVVDLKCKGVNTLTICHAAYSQQCYNSSAGQKKEGRRAFAQCCGGCQHDSAEVHTTCTWSMQVPGGSFGTTYEYPSGSHECFRGCQAIMGVQKAEDLCPGSGSVHAKIKECDSAAWPATFSADTLCSVKAEMCRHKSYFAGLCKMTIGQFEEADLCGQEPDLYTLPNGATCGSSSGMLIEDAQLLQNTIGANGVGFGIPVAFMFFIGTAVAFLLKRRRAQRPDGYVNLAA